MKEFSGWLFTLHLPTQASQSLQHFQASDFFISSTLLYFSSQSHVSSCYLIELQDSKYLVIQLLGRITSSFPFLLMHFSRASSLLRSPSRRATFLSPPFLDSPPFFIFLLLFFSSRKLLYLLLVDLQY